MRAFLLSVFGFGLNILLGESSPFRPWFNALFGHLLAPWALLGFATLAVFVAYRLWLMATKRFTWLASTETTWTAEAIFLLALLGVVLPVLGIRVGRVAGGIFYAIAILALILIYERIIDPPTRKSTPTARASKRRHEP